MIIVPNVLYCDKFPERFGLIAEQMREQGIENYNLCEPVYDNNIVRSINLSQKKIVRDAMERGDKKACIIEDDILFPCAGAWDYFLANMPKTFSVYIGGTYLLDNRNKWQKPLVKVNEWVGNHCIVIDESYFKTFLNIPDDKHIDTANKGLGDFYVCFPFAALQRPGFSSNNMAQVNYNAIVPKEYIYNGE